MLAPWPSRRLLHKAKVQFILRSPAPPSIPRDKEMAIIGFLHLEVFRNLSTTVFGFHVLPFHMFRRNALIAQFTLSARRNALPIFQTGHTKAAGSTEIFLGCRATGANHSWVAPGHVDTAHLYSAIFDIAS